MNQAFIGELRKRAKRAGYSQRRIAREMGVSATAVYYWTSGRSEPTLENVARLEQMLGCEKGTLLIPLAYPPSQQVGG